MIYKTTDIVDTYQLLSQTPPNYDKTNYYLDQLQKKVDADWNYRPNRVTIEKETGIGTEKYQPLEVVLQTVKNDKGEPISDDWRKVVYKDIRTSTRIGERFLFSYDFDVNLPLEQKNVWIATNQNSGNPTCSQVICRCNGTIGSIYVDEDGVNSYHYEPIVQSTKLESANFKFDETVVNPKGQLIIIAQNNKYTEQYYINERFIIGTNQVYKVNSILRTDARMTFNPTDVGLIRIYLDIDQSGELDDFVKRIAYNGLHEDPIVPETKGSYKLKLAQPVNLPTALSTTGLIIEPKVYRDDTIDNAIEIEVSCNLEGIYKDKAKLEDFVSLVKNGDGTWTAKRLKSELTLTARFTCKATIDPTLDPLELTFNLKLFG